MEALLHKVDMRSLKVRLLSIFIPNKSTESVVSILLPSILIVLASEFPEFVKSLAGIFQDQQSYYFT